MERAYFVYILASKRNGTLYIGVTNNLARRMFEHKEGLGSAFTKKYGVTMLVYYEGHGETGAAIARENAMKQWRRKWKLDLIEYESPTWRDLSQDFLG